jgi:DNA-directed RNA polymerase omega subunit
MIEPSLEELSRGIYNRYELVIATAKAARKITDMQYIKREEMLKTAEEKNNIYESLLAASKQSEKVKKDAGSKNRNQDEAYLKNYDAFMDEKAIKSAILNIYSGKLIIISESAIIEQISSSFP